jgi:hypothetical protein
VGLKPAYVILQTGVHLQQGCRRQKLQTRPKLGIERKHAQPTTHKLDYVLRFESGWQRHERCAVVAADQDDSRDLLAKQLFRTGLMRRIDTELNRAREGMAYVLFGCAS